MSDISSQCLPGGTGDQPTGSSTDSGSSSDSMTDLGNSFLQGIPEADRPVVGKYIQQWDQGVNKRFQDIHSQYAPYKSLGDVEALQQAVAIAQALEDNPEYIYNELAQILGKAAPGNNTQSQGTPNQIPDSSQVPPEIAQYLNPFQDQVAQQQKMLEQMAQILIQTNEGNRAKEEDAQLDNYLSGLKQKHGDFNEEAVLFQMMKGVDGDQAVENWKNSVLEQAKSLGYTTYQGPNPPPPLGGGTIPSAETSVTDMDRKEVQGLVADIFKSVSQASQG